MLPVTMPPTGSTSASAGSTARKAFTAAGPIISAGRASGRWRRRPARRKPQSASVRRGRHTSPKRTDSRTISALKLGATTSWPPAACTSRTFLGLEHRSRAHQRIGESLGQRGDAAHGIRRVERHLDQLPAARDQRFADGVGFVRLQAAQDRDQRADSQCALEFVECVSCRFLQRLCNGPEATPACFGSYAPRGHAQRLQASSYRCVSACAPMMTTGCRSACNCCERNSSPMTRPER